MTSRLSFGFDNPTTIERIEIDFLSFSPAFSAVLFGTKPVLDGSDGLISCFAADTPPPPPPPPPDPGVIPLPAALPLLLAGLGAIGLLGRRRG